MTISWHFLPDPTKEPLAQGEQVLGSIVVGGAESASSHPTLSVDMDVLGSAQRGACFVTQLRTSQSVTQCTLPSDAGLFKVAQTEEHLFGVVELNPQLDLQTASYRAYKALLDLCLEAGKPHLLRLWNFMPHITAPENGEERYRLFNTGRHKALMETNYLATHGAPAACALGTHRGALKIAFLAATKPCTPVENPRQVSAYNYPKDYGFNPPIFSRAAWFTQDGGQDMLFLSGTASIVGHQSLHLGDVALQTQETVRNIQAVLQEANRLADRNLWDVKNLQGQVFVRHPGDMATIQGILQQHNLVNFTYVHADVCRAELLVEIEAYAQL